MYYHSKHNHTNPSDFPLSIVAGIEMGSLNRYTNVWPFGKKETNAEVVVGGM